MQELTRAVRQYLKERKWDRLRPGDVAKSISIEAAELLELFQWENPSLADTKKNKAKMEEIKKELADVMLYCLDMAVVLGFDPKQAVLDKLAQVKAKYPAKLMADRAQKKGRPYNEAYLTIKRAHRAKANS